MERCDHHDCIGWLVVPCFYLGCQQVPTKGSPPVLSSSSFRICMVGDLDLLPLLCAGIAEKVASETRKLKPAACGCTDSEPVEPAGQVVDPRPRPSCFSLGGGVLSFKEARKLDKTSWMIAAQRPKHGFSIFCLCGDLAACGYQNQPRASHRCTFGWTVVPELSTAWRHRRSNKGRHATQRKYGWWCPRSDGRERRARRKRDQKRPTYATLNAHCPQGRA